MSAIESRHCHRNPPSAAVPCRQPIRCQPSDLVPYCQAPSRHRHSPLKQRPILFARLRSLPQPFVPCRRVAVEGCFHPSANLAYSPFCRCLPSQFCNFAISTFVIYLLRAAGTNSIPADLIHSGGRTRLPKFRFSAKFPIGLHVIL